MKVLRGIAVTLTAAILASGGGTAATLITAQPAQAAQAAVSQPQTDAAITQILNETNAERAKAGLAPLKLTQSMNTVSQNWSVKMGSGTGMIHNPEYPWELPQPWIRVGENVGQGYTPSTIVPAWMASEGHKKNILGDFTHIGLGYYVDGTGRGWFTQNFAKYEVPQLTTINEPATTIGKFDFTSSWEAKWDEPVDSYKVELYSASGSLLRTETTTVPTVSFTGLTDLTTYTVKVSAQKTDVPGFLHTSPVKTYTVTTLEDSPEVSAPANLTLVATDTTVSADWDAPVASHGTIQPYTVELKTGSTVVQSVQTTATNYAFSGLQSKTDYTVNVTAATTLRGNTATAVATKTVQTAPSAVASVTDVNDLAVVSESYSTIKATWATPTTKIGVGLKYKLTLSAAGKPDAVIETTALSHVFTGLTSDTPYTVKVQANITAENGINTSTSTGVSKSLKTLINNAAVSVTAPTLLPVQVEAKQAILNWNAPATVVGKLVDYTVIVKQAGQPDRVFTTTAKTYTVTGLLENSTYTFSVKANAASLNDVNRASATSASATHTTPYAPDTVIVSSPRSLTATAVSTTSVTASWEVPSTVVGKITGYMVVLKSDSAVISTKNVTTLNTSFTDLKSDTVYIISVTALAASSDSTKTAMSAPATAGVTTLGEHIAAPNAPTAFKASEVTHSGAKLSWATPTGVIGTLKNYTITVKQTGVADKIITATGNSYALTDLKENTSYTVQIAANVTSSTGNRTVTSPSANVSVKTPMPFNDLGGNVFVKEISWMKTKGITTGYGDGSYRPYDTVTREQMAAFMYRMAGSPDYTAPIVSPFVDVPTSHVFYKEISWMRASGISTGWSDGTYRPYTPVLREAMAAFMQRYATKVCSVDVPASKYFVDGNTSVFIKEIGWMGGAGISTGWADNTYRPFTSTTREQMAAFMYRLDSHINSNGGCK